MLLSVNPGNYPSKSRPTSSTKKNALDAESFEKERRRSFMFNESSLDKELHHWEEYKLQGKRVQRRCYHSSVFYGKILYVYGGYESQQGILQDFISVNLDESLPEFQWEVVDVQSQLKPSPLCRHSAIVYKDRMYIFGGQISSLKNTNQFMSYNFTTKEWNNVKPTNVDNILPIDSHVATIWKKEDGSESMIVIGGFIGGEIGEYSNAVFEYKIEDNTWHKLFHNKVVESDESKKKGIPQGRMSMGAAICKNQLYMFGGNEGNTKFNDLWKFDLYEKKWTQVKVEGSFCPEPRSGATMIHYKNSLIIFGGILDVTHEKNDIFVFNLEKSYWDVAEQATKWVFQPEEKNNVKATPIKKSQFSRNEPEYKIPSHSLSHSPLKKTANHYKSHSNIKLQVQKVDSADFLSNASDLSYDTSTVDNKSQTFSPRTMRFEKLKLPSVYQNGVSGRGGEDLSKMLTNRAFKSTLEENQIRNKLLQKQMLLNEFYVTEEEAKTLRAPTPTTDSLIKSLENLTINPHSLERIEHNLTNREGLTSKIATHEEKIKAGVKPVGRDGHTACILGDKMFIFAGDRHKMAFNDLFALNLTYFRKV